MRRVFEVLPLSSLLALLIVLGVSPAATASPTAFASGSLIVPMDATYQNFGMFKSYGLVYRLLQSGVPVRWAIGNPKSPDLFNGVDFQATTIDHYTSAPIGSPYSYRGGAFVIDSADVASADPIIAAWRAANSNQPAIHAATATFTANVDITLRSAPRIALESINAGIAIAYFNAAGIPDNKGNVWSSASPNVLNVGLIACNNGSASTCPAVVGDSALFKAGGCLSRQYDVFVTPHNGGYSYSKTDPTNVGTQAYAELDNFVNQGGGWIALCHSILSNENAVVDLYNSTGAVRALFPSAAPGGFLTRFGFPAIDNVGGTWNVKRPDLPLAQAVPTTPAQTLPGGSVQTWHAPDGTPSFVQYWNTTERVADFATPAAVEYDWALNGVYHNGAGSGKMTYLGGHSYSTSLPYSGNSEAPYLRFFYNALFFNGSAVASMALQPSVSSVSQAQATPVQLVLKNTGSSTATNVGAAGGITITLQPQVAYLSTAVGPSPAVASGAGGTTVLTWGNLGNVEGGAAALVINTNVAFPATGSQQMASIAGTYGDNFQEQFTSRSCTSLQVNPAPAAAIDKTPVLQGPLSVGSVVTWTLAYSNPGSAGLLNPAVDDVFPTGLQFLSATPPPTYVVPVPGGTRAHWTLPSPLATGAGGSIIVRASVQTATGQPFTNSATLSGTDAANAAVSASDSASVIVSPPEARLDKSVAPSGTVGVGATLTYTLAPGSPGPTLFNRARLFDAPPQFTTYVNSSANQGGTFGPYAPVAGTPGTDPGPGPATNVSLSAGTTPFTVAVGSTVTVTMVLTNSDPSAGGFPITGVTPSALVPGDSGTTCSAPSPPTVASIAVNGGTATITYTCTIGSLGEISFIGGADGTYNGTAYSFSAAESNTVLGVGTTTGTSVITWAPAAPNSNTPDVPSSSFVPNTGPALFALDGGTATWERYGVTTNAWISSPGSLANLPGSVADGGALVYDGLGAPNGYVYAFQGGSTAFWRYKLSTGVAGTWAAVASTPSPVAAGGALVVQNGIFYALQGSSNAFWKYDSSTNLWTALAPLPAVAGAGAALASAGPFVYALQGNNTNKFWRYNPATDNWLAMPNNSAGNAKAGTAMITIGSTIYSIVGGSNHASRFVPNLTTGKWSNLKNAPANFGAGGALTTDGTTVWALRGAATKVFWTYSVASNAWGTILATTLNNINNAGNKLAWVPPTQEATNTNTLLAPVLVTGSAGSPATITLKQTLTSSVAVGTVTPGTITINKTGTGTSTPVCTVSPPNAPAVADVDLMFTWTCTGVSTSSTFGTMTFSAGATGTSPPAAWTAATSNSVLLTPPLTFQATVNAAPTTFTTVTNTSVLADDVAFTPGIGSNAVITPITRPANIQLTKSANPASGSQVGPGNTITYTVVAQNASPGAAANLVVSDPLPANASYVSCAVSGGSVNTCGLAAGTVTYNVGALAGFGSATLTLTVTANLPAAAGSFPINNKASATATGITIVDSNTVSHSLFAKPAATIVKSQSVAPPPDANGFITPGSTITYTLLVSVPANVVPATNVVVTDAIPAGATLVPGSCLPSCTFITGPPPQVTFNVATIAAGTSATLSFHVTVDNPAEDGGSIDNAAVVTADGGLSVTSLPVSYPIKASPSLAISKSASPASGSVVATDQVITYTLVVKNTGNANTDSAFISDDIPANTTYVAGSTTVNATPVAELEPGVPPVLNMKVYSPCCADPGGDGGTLVSENAPGGTANDATVTFQVRVTTPPGIGSSIVNQASARTSTTAPVSSNTTTHATAAQADVGVAKSGPANVVSHAGVSYALVVTNGGPAPADGAVVTDAAVPNFSASAVTCSSASGGAVCPPSPTVAQLQAGLAIPTLPGGGSVTLTVSGTAGVSGSITNTATVAPPAGVTDPVPGNNSSTKITAITTLADLTVSKSSTPNPYVPGSALSYRIVVTNGGPGDASNARVQDALPAPLAGFAWTCTPSGAGSSCGTPAGVGDIDALVTLAAGTSATFAVSGTVPPGTTGALSNRATVTPPLGVTDPVPGNNAGTDNNPVGPQADLIVSKGSSPNPYVPGTPLTYTVVVANTGPSDVIDARVQDALPAPLAGFGWTCAPGDAGASCATPAGSGDIDALVSLPVGTFVTFTVSGTVPAATTGPLVNTATVTPPIGVTDPVPGNNAGTDSNPAGPQANLAITKLSDPNPYVPGDPLSYTVVVTNAGPGDVILARVQDALPPALAGFAWTCAPSGAGATCATPAGSGDIDALVTLPVGTSATFTVSGTVPAATTGQLVNTATVTPPLGVTDPVPGDDTATDGNPSGPQADLSITKVGSPKPYVPGAPFTYTIVVANAGPSDVTNARVQDELPAALTEFSWTCTPSGAGASCGAAARGGDIDALVTLPVGTSATFRVTGTVPPETTGTLVNTATVTPPIGVSDAFPGNDQATDSSPAGPQADLTVSKASNPNPYVSGTPLTYTVVVTNSGPSDVTDARLQDPLPPALTGFTWTCTPSGAGASCATPTGAGDIDALLTLPVGTSATFTVSGTVPPGTTGALINTATATPPLGVTDPVPGNNEGSDSNPAGPQADLTVSKASSPIPYVPGALLTYTVLVANAGPSNATDARVQDALPPALAGFTWTCAPSGAGASCGTPTGTGDIDVLLTLPAGTSATFTVSGTVPPGTTGALINTATVAPPVDVTDPVPGNDEATDSNPVGPQADLTISKASSPDPYVPGTLLTYTVVVANSGPSNVTNARVQDALPSALAGFAWTCVPSGAGATCATPAGSGDIDALVTLPVGTSATFTVSGTVPAGTVGSLVNTATVTPPVGVTDPVPGNNAATDTNSAAPQADLGITKAGSPHPYVPGASLTYTVVVSNSGPSDVSDARVQDPLPPPLAGFTWTCTPSEVSASCATPAGTGDIDALVTLPAETSATFTVSGTVPAGTTGQLVNTATATPPLAVTDPVPGNNQATDSDPAGPEANLGITKMGSPHPYVPGTSLTYTIVVTNGGPSNVTNARVQDALPAPLAAFAWTCTPSGAGASCGTTTGSGDIDTLVTLPVGTSATFTVSGTVPPETTGTLVNTATVTPPVGTTDPASGNNEATDDDLAGPQADLTLTKVGSPNPYVPGAALTYIIIASNTGPSNVTNARVQDVLPAPLAGFGWICTPSGAGASCGTTSGTGDIDALVTLPVGTSATFTVSGTVPAETTGDLVNTATVTPPLGVTDPVPGNDAAIATIPANPRADLTVSKASSPNPYVSGTLLTYTVVIANAGPSDVTNARVQDPLPPALTGFTWTCTPSGVGASCATPAGTGDIDALVTLPVGTSATFTVSGTVPPGTTGALINTATVTPPLGVTDPVPGNNEGIDGNPAGPHADLTVSKASSPNPYVPGALLTYTVVVANDGPSDATNARVQDALPPALAGFTWTCAPSGAGASCATPAGSGDIDALVTLPAGTSATFAVSGTVPPGTTGALINTATVTPPVDVTDPVPGNDEGTDSNPVGPQADLTISKASIPDPYVPGTLLTYTVIVANSGPSNVTNARVQDALPPALAGFAWTCVPSGAGASCGSASGSGNIDALVTLQAGTFATFTVSGTVPAATTGQLINMATVTPPIDVTDPVPGNDAATDTNPTGPQANLAISKASSPDPYVAGTLLTYTVVVANGGPSNVTNARVQDALPPALTGFTWTCAPSGAGASCATPTGTGDIDALVTLPAGTSATFTVSGTVPAGTTGQLVNTATVTPPLDVNDPVPGDDTATDTNPSGPQANLSITKVSSPNPYVPGASFNYTVVVTNSGPSDVTNARVQDELPAALTGFSWICTPSGAGAACGAAARGGDIDALVTLPVGTSATFTVSGTVPAGTTGQLINTASVMPPLDVTDPVADDNDATDTNPVDLQADLTTSKASSPNPYVPGAALSYTIVVTNSGPSDVSNARLQDPLPPALAGFTWTCAPSGAGASCGTAAGTGDIDALVTLPAGTSATFTVNGTVPPGTTGALMNTATATPPLGVTDPVPGDNAATDTNPTGPQADLTISKASSPDPYVPGTLLTYTVVVANTGPSNATDARVQDALPPALAGFTWTCAPSGAGASCGTAAGTGDIDALVTLPAGTSATFTVSGTVPPGTVEAVVNTATVTPPLGVTDPVPGDNAATDTNPTGPQADLTISKASSPDPYVPGAPLTYTVVVANDGPSNVTNARVQDALPPALAGFTWTCLPSGAGASCATPNGTGDIDALVTLPVGTNATFSVTGTVPPGTAGALVNTATVTPPVDVTDPVPGNNEGTNSNPAGPQADLTISKASSPNPYVPGAALTYTIVVTNAGPGDVTDARMQDTLPTALAGFTWTCAASGAGASCATPSGTGDVDALVTLPVGTSATFTVSGTVPPGTVGAVVNTATVTPPVEVTDPVPGDNAATDANPTGAQADLAITKVSTPNPYVPGSPMTYTLIVSNGGPSDVSDARVQDALPPALAAFTWTCAPSGAGASCATPVGTGDIDALVTLPVGTSATFTVSGTVPPGTVGALVNTATATPPPGVTDPVPGDNAATDANPTGAQADLAISKVSHPNPYAPGAPLSYTVVVSNGGPSNVTNARVQDALPPALAGFTWTCTTSGAGASCASPTGAGDIDALVTLPAGTSATFTVSGTVPAGTTGQLMNTATVTAPAGVTDPVPGDDGETDTNPAPTEADLSIRKSSSPNPYVPGTLLTYSVVVTNAGPSDASDARVQDTLPAALAGFGWTCVPSGAGASCGTPSGTGDIDALVTLPVGTSATFTVSGTVPPETTGALVNTATVTPPAGTTDPASGNDAATDTNPTELQANLAIQKTSSPDKYVPGAPLTYTIVVTNGGPSGADGARVQDTLPAALAAFTWACTPSGAGASCGTASGSGNIDALVTLPAGTSATFTLSGIVPAETTGTLVNTATVAPPPGVTDPASGNNSSVARTSPVTAIPALDALALAFLAMLLGLAAAWELARRRI